MTLWIPDTCTCEIIISDDPTAPDWGEPVARPHTCAIHAALATPMLGVLQENQLKNRVGVDAEARFPGTVFDWSFDALRILVLASNLSHGKKHRLQHFLNNKYGVGKVKVV